MGEHDSDAAKVDKITVVLGGSRALEFRIAPAQDAPWLERFERISAADATNAGAPEIAVVPHEPGTYAVSWTDGPYGVCEALDKLDGYVAAANQLNDSRGG